MLRKIRLFKMSIKICFKPFLIQLGFIVLFGCSQVNEQASFERTINNEDKTRYTRVLCSRDSSNWDRFDIPLCAKWVSMVDDSLVSIYSSLHPNSKLDRNEMIDSAIIEECPDVMMSFEAAARTHLLHDYHLTKINVKMLEVCAIFPELNNSLVVLSDTVFALCTNCYFTPTEYYSRYAIFLDSWRSLISNDLKAFDKTFHLDSIYTYVPVSIAEKTLFYCCNHAIQGISKDTFVDDYKERKQESVVILSTLKIILKDYLEDRKKWIDSIPDEEVRCCLNKNTSDFLLSVAGCFGDAIGF